MDEGDGEDCGSPEVRGSLARCEGRGLMQSGDTGL